MQMINQVTPLPVELEHRRLDDKMLLFKKTNPVVPTDFVPVPAKTPGMSTFRLDASSCAATGWVRPQARQSG